MKKLIELVLSMVCALFLCSCGWNSKKAVTNPSNPPVSEPVVNSFDDTEEEQIEIENIETNIDNEKEVVTLTWSEITENGVDEQLLMDNLDVELLETIAGEIQAIVEDEAAAERENPEIVLAEGWIRVFQTERYR